MLYFTQITLFCLEYRLSKHNMTTRFEIFGDHGTLGPPGYAHDCIPAQTFVSMS